MLIIANFLITIAGLCNFVINAYSFIIIVAAFMSWCNPNPYNGFVRAVTSMTEPLLGRLRARFPFLMFNGFDCTPVAVLLFLQLVNGVVIQTLMQLGQRIMM